MHPPPPRGGVLVQAVVAVCKVIPLWLVFERCVVAWFCTWMCSIPCTTWLLSQTDRIGREIAPCAKSGQVVWPLLASLVVIARLHVFVLQQGKRAADHKTIIPVLSVTSAAAFSTVYSRGWFGTERMAGVLSAVKRPLRRLEGLGLPWQAEGRLHTHIQKTQKNGLGCPAGGLRAPEAARRSRMF